MCRRLIRPLFDTLLSAVLPDEPYDLRTAAANVLASAALASEQRLVLADAMSKVGPFELPKLLPIFEREPTQEQGQRLIAALGVRQRRAGSAGRARQAGPGEIPGAGRRGSRKAAGLAERDHWPSRRRSSIGSSRSCPRATFAAGTRSSSARRRPARPAMRSATSAAAWVRI